MLEQSLDYPLEVPFVTGYAQQQYLKAEAGIISAKKDGCAYWYIDGSLESDMPHFWGRNRIDSLKKQIDIHQVKPIFHGNFKSPLSFDVEDIRKAAVEYTKKEVDIAHQLNAPLILHGSVLVEPRLICKAKKLALDNYLRSIRELHEYAQSKSVVLYLENLCNYKHHRPFHYIFTNAEEIEYILSNIAEINLFLDIGHANVGDGNPVDLIRKYHKRIVGMSFSNNNGQFDQHLGLNQGTVDYHIIIKSILETQWKGVIGFETRGQTTRDSILDLNAIYQEVINPWGVAA
jgi:L-ribulose-5-phosphate 3-epimerase